MSKKYFAVTQPIEVTIDVNPLLTYIENNISDLLYDAITKQADDCSLSDEPEIDDGEFIFEGTYETTAIVHHIDGTLEEPPEDNEERQVTSLNESKIQECIASQLVNHIANKYISLDLQTLIQNLIKIKIRENSYNAKYKEIE